jgi:hypothetical protein
MKANTSPDDVAERLLQAPAVAKDRIARELVWILTRPTGTTSSGYAYLQPGAWRRFRDWVPHILANGQRVLDATSAVTSAAASACDDETRRAIDVAAGVVRQVVRTAAICAPPDLWILRHVVGALAATGLAERLLAGDVVGGDGAEAHGVRPDELAIDLRFLLSRGLLVRVEGVKGGHRLGPHAHARDVLSLGPIGDVDAPLPEERREAGLWSPTARDVEVGARLVPLVVELAAAGRTDAIVEGDALRSLDARSLRVLEDAGVVVDARLTDVGRRVLERGPGPFGIIEAYRTYFSALPRIWREGRGGVHVERGANVAASQAANAKSFSDANDALDAFCADTGFTYSVFIEHALGKGEATRQRASRASGRGLVYVGADLEDAAIAAAREEQKKGALPSSMIFVERADIGEPSRVVDAIRAAGASTEGAVMIVGNGFHEVRGQTDARMTAVFEGYERAGIVLLFTEESALAVDDLVETAWNTYHAGFRYVHERSGQGLRPATPRPPLPLEGDTHTASWSECAERAGYVRAEAYCRRGRTVYPYPPPSGHNPAISVSHFFVPGRIALKLGLR